MLLLVLPFTALLSVRCLFRFLTLRCPFSLLVAAVFALPLLVSHAPPASTARKGTLLALFLFLGPAQTRVQLAQAPFPHHFVTAQFTVVLRSRAGFS